MTPSPAPVGDSPSGLVRRWPASLRGRVNAVCARSLDSTQTLARRLLDRHFAEDETPEPFAVIALAQSAGLGRRGRAWSSGSGLGVWASLAVPVADRERLQALPMRVAVALADVVARVGGAACRLKWPNDLVIGRRKLGGILIDAVSRHDRDLWAVIGFGINHGHGESELPAPEAVSLRLAGATPLPALGELAGATVAAVFEEIASDRPWLERYRALTAHAAGDPIECEVAGERLAGRFAGFDERGFLRLATAAGERVVASGEVFSW